MLCHSLLFIIYAKRIYNIKTVHYKVLDNVIINSGRLSTSFSCAHSAHFIIYTNELIIFCNLLFSNIFKTDVINFSKKEMAHVLIF